MYKKIIKLLFFILVISMIVLIINYIQNKQFTDFFYDKKETRENLILDLKNSKINIDKNNKVVLTKKYNNLAENNYIDVFKCDNEECVVAFLYKAGFPDEDKFIVYTSKDDELIKKYIDKGLYHHMKKIDDNWYLVQCN